MLRRFRSWRRFHYGPRRAALPLLADLHRYPDAVLVAGCQRSGTTMLTRIIANSDGFRGLALTKDDELDAALVLSGNVQLPKSGRYCFQTTYLNERVDEYTALSPRHRLIWVLRNPYSVVHSMIYNWRRFALNELYEACGVARAETSRQKRSSLPWPFGPSLIEKACLSYAAKTAQIREISALLPREQLMIVDYDVLVESPHDCLPRVFAFIGREYDPTYAQGVKTSSLGKAQNMRADHRDIVERVARPVYESCRQLVVCD